MQMYDSTKLTLSLMKSEVSLETKYKKSQEMKEKIAKRELYQDNQFANMKEPKRKVKQ